MNWTRIREDDLHGVRFAVCKTSSSATIVWMLLQHVVGISPIWAIASLVAAKLNHHAQILHVPVLLINTGVGCAIGLVVPHGRHIGMATALRDRRTRIVLFGSYSQRGGGAPTTAAIVITSGLMQHSRDRRRTGLGRVSKVVFGCIVGIAVSWIMSKAWPVWNPPNRRPDAVTNRLDNGSIGGNMSIAGKKREGGRSLGALSCNLTGHGSKWASVARVGFG